MALFGDPKKGQYQHDMPKTKMESELSQIIEECVSFIGVDVNLADVHLLSRVSGLTMSRAQAIIAYRQKNGGISNLSEISKIKGIGPKSYKQAAGFLRIDSKTLKNGNLENVNPLDNTWVHPEVYELGNWFQISILFS